MQTRVPFTQFAQSTPLFTLAEARNRYRKDRPSRSILNQLHRLKRQGRVRQVASGVYAGALANIPVNRYSLPAAVREDAVIAFHSALEWHGVANQVFQTVYYLSRRARKDVVFDNLTYHCVTLPQILKTSRWRHFQIHLDAHHVRVTDRERSFVDCLMFLEFSGGVDELDKSLAMFPSFDFDAALQYLKLLKKPWLFARLGFLLDRHADKLFFRGPWRDKFLRYLPSGIAYLADKRPGNRWVPTWRIMVPQTLLDSSTERIKT